MSSKTSTRKIVIASMLAVLTCVATMIIKIPSPMKGYLNLGDCVVLLAGWMLSPVYGFVAAGLGSGLADLFSGYVFYAPATFVIKGLMALIACWGFRLLHKKLGDLTSRILTGLVAEVLMVLGYFLFEGLFYGFISSVVNVPANGIQGLAGLILGCVLIQQIQKYKIFKTE